MELIEKEFYDNISRNIIDLDTLLSFSEGLHKNNDPRARLVSLELALEFGEYLKEYKNYKCPVDLSSDESLKSTCE